MAAAYESFPDQIPVQPNGPILEPVVAAMQPQASGLREDAALNVDIGPAQDQRARLGHTIIIRSLDQIADGLNLPKLGEIGVIPGERSTISVKRAIGEVGISGYEALLDELTRPLPTPEFAPVMPEPPVAEWAARRQQLDMELDARLAAIYQRTPWQMQAYDRRKAWSEIGQSLRGLIPFRHRPRGEATFDMAGQSALYLLETHSARLGRNLANVPYAFSAWGDRQLTHIENAVYGFGRMVTGGARHIGETRGWELIKQAADSRPADIVISGVLFAASVAEAVGQDFAKHPLNTAGFLASLPFTSAWSGITATARISWRLIRDTPGFTRDTAHNIANSPLGDIAMMAFTAGKMLNDAPAYYAGRQIHRLTPERVKRGLRAVHERVYSFNDLTRRWFPEPRGYEFEQRTLALINDIKARPDFYREEWAWGRFIPDGPGKLPHRWIDAKQPPTTEKGSLSILARLAELGDLPDNDEASTEDGTTGEMLVSEPPVVPEIFVPLTEQLLGGQHGYRFVTVPDSDKFQSTIYRRGFTLADAKQAVLAKHGSLEGVEIVDLGVAPFFARRSFDPNGQPIAPITTQEELSAYLARNIPVLSDETRKRLQAEWEAAQLNSSTAAEGGVKLNSTGAAQAQ